VLAILRNGARRCGPLTFNVRPRDMEYRDWLFVTLFAGPTALAVLWWWLGHTRRNAAKSLIAGAGGLLLGAFCLYRVTNGILEGVVSLPHQLYSGAFQRGLDGMHFWAVCTFWFMLGIIILGASINAIRRRHLE
jgi:hypothetical protein